MKKGIKTFACQKARDETWKKFYKGHKLNHNLVISQKNISIVLNKNKHFVDFEIENIQGCLIQNYFIICIIHY